MCTSGKPCVFSSPSTCICVCRIYKCEKGQAIPTHLHLTHIHTHKTLIGHEEVVLAHHPQKQRPGRQHQQLRDEEQQQVRRAPVYVSPASIKGNKNACFIHTFVFFSRRLFLSSLPLFLLAFCELCMCVKLALKCAWLREKNMGWQTLWAFPSKLIWAKMTLLNVT